MALEKGFSRLPVYHKNLDDIVGILYVKDLLRLVEDPAGEMCIRDRLSSSWASAALTVPQTATCHPSARSKLASGAAMAASSSTNKISIFYPPAPAAAGFCPRIPPPRKRGEGEGLFFLIVTDPVAFCVTGLSSAARPGRELE